MPKAPKANDKIEVQINAIWKPAKVVKLFNDGEYFEVSFEGRQPNTTVLTINQFTVWRYPD